MEELYQLQSVCIGLIGWAATSLLILGSTRLTINDRRMAIVCSWMLWLMPALGALVYRGLLTTQTAALYCGATTLIMAAIVAVSAVRPRTRP
jgi:magnesium-transporting ATPase (P-type)